MTGHWRPRGCSRIDSTGYRRVVDVAPSVSRTRRASLRDRRRQAPHHWRMRSLRMGRRRERSTFGTVSIKTAVILAVAVVPAVMDMTLSVAPSCQGRHPPRFWPGVYILFGPGRLSRGYIRSWGDLRMGWNTGSRAKRPAFERRSGVRISQDVIGLGPLRHPVAIQR